MVSLRYRSTRWEIRQALTKKIYIGFLFTLFLNQPLSFAADQPAGKIDVSSWNFSVGRDHDSGHEHGWATTRPAQYKTTDKGVELILCHGWGCKNTVSYLWDVRHFRKISRNIAYCSTNAENELLALRNAIRDAEKEIIKKLPIFSGDVAGNVQDRLNPGRLDCIDSSSNTNTILRALQEYKPFQYWQVYKPQGDGFFKPHRSASVMTKDPRFIEKYRSKTRMGNKNHTVWVVDTWLTTFAHKPFLYEVRDWKYKLDPWGNELYLGLYEKKLACWK